jgi:hypothetical protein
MPPPKKQRSSNKPVDKALVSPKFLFSTRANLDSSWFLTVLSFRAIGCADEGGASIV